MIYLTGLRDDYEHDGRVITQILSEPNDALSGPAVIALGECYKQLNASVGAFGAATLIASTAAIKGTSPGDSTYHQVDAELRALEVVRDRLAQQIKNELEAAAFGDDAQGRDQRARSQLAACQGVIERAQDLASAG